MRHYLSLFIALAQLFAAPYALAVDINGQLKKAQLEKLSSDPTGSEARIYYNTTNHVPLFYNGTSWLTEANTGNKLSSFAATTSAELAGVLSDETGSGGGFVRATGPTLSAPVLGAATATSITFSPTTGGIIGTTTNDSASAGTVGEYKSDGPSTDVCSLTVTRTVTDTGITLSAGDWDLSAVCDVAGGGGSQTGVKCGLSSSSGDNETDYATGNNVCSSYVTAAVSGAATCSIPNWRVSVASGTPTYYLKVKCLGQVNTVTGRISARRVR